MARNGPQDAPQEGFKRGRAGASWGSGYGVVGRGRAVWLAGLAARRLLVRISVIPFHKVGCVSAVCFQNPSAFGARGSQLSLPLNKVGCVSAVCFQNPSAFAAHSSQLSLPLNKVGCVSAVCFQNPSAFAAHSSQLSLPLHGECVRNPLGHRRRGTACGGKEEAAGKAL